jgi:hypothetical protein
MTVSPSLVKGHSLRGTPVTTAHVVVIAAQPQGQEFLDVASQWVNAGVLEPAVWVPSEDLTVEGEGLSNPTGVVLARGDFPVVQRVSILEALAREPHDHIIVTVIAPPTDVVSDPGWASRVERLLTTLAAARPHSRSLGHQAIRGTDIRVLNLIFPPADSGNPGLSAAQLRSSVVDVENLVINPEDRPTPVSIDTIPRPGTPRWAAQVVSTTATLAGLWSSMATSPVVPDANWIAGNVRVVRTFARVVLTHPLISQVATSTKDVLLGDACPVDVPGVQMHPEPLHPMSEAQLAQLSQHYADWLIQESPLGYVAIEAFEPPSVRKRGFMESLRAFGSFARDKLAALPRWVTRRVLNTFNAKATQKIYGDDGLISVDARKDLNLRADDPKLIDAWDFVALQRAELNAVISAPTEPPEESDDPTPWIKLHEAVALFSEGLPNAEQPSLMSDRGIVQVAGSLGDVIPHPDDEFVVDAECDALLGGDGTSRQVSWLDADGAGRLDGLLSTVIKRSRKRVADLESAYRHTERDFFTSQVRYLEARFAKEDAAALDKRESRIAAADMIFRQDSDGPSSVDSDKDIVVETDGYAFVVATDGDIVVETDGAGHLEEDSASNVPHSEEADGVGSYDEAEDEDDEVEDYTDQDLDAIDPEGDLIDVDIAWPRDPFKSPLDDSLPHPEDLSGLFEDATAAALAAERERRLRGALSEVTSAERDRVKAAQAELKLLQRTHMELTRWVERRSASLIGRILRGIDAEGQRMNALEEQVLNAARASEPEVGTRSVELQRAYVSAVLKGLAFAAGIAAVLSLINGIAASIARTQDSPTFTGIPWWLVLVIFVICLVLALLLPLVSYFQAWTREKIRAEDARAELVYQTRLVSHVRQERMRLARLHMQVPQRVRALGLWWHYWDASLGKSSPRLTPGVPGCDTLPHHLQWAVSDWTHSAVFRRIRDDLLQQHVGVGYRSSLIDTAASAYGQQSGLGEALSIGALARMRSTEALELVEGWSSDERARFQSTAALERGLAQQAQSLNKEAGQASPRVQLLNPDPISGLVIQTDLLEDPYATELSTNDFLLGIAVDGAEMGHRLWDYGIGVQDYRSFFAGPDRLREKLPTTVAFVDVEASKVCSSEVSVRLDITDQVSATKLRCIAPKDESDEAETED